MEVVRVAVSRELVSDSERTMRSRLQLADPVHTENMVQAVFEWLCIEARGIVARAMGDSGAVVEEYRDEVTQARAHTSR